MFLSLVSFLAVGDAHALTTKGSACYKMSPTEWFTELVGNKFIEAGTCFQYSLLVDGTTSGRDKTHLQVLGQSALDGPTAGKALWMWWDDEIKWPEGDGFWEEGPEVDPGIWEPTTVIPKPSLPNTWNVFVPQGDVAVATVTSSNPERSPKFTLLLDDDDDGELELKVIWLNGTVTRVDPYHPGIVVNEP